MHPYRLLHMVGWFLCALPLLFSAIPAQANGGKPLPQPGVHDQDDNQLRVRVWYIQDYGNCSPFGLTDLTNTRSDALGASEALTHPVDGKLFLTNRWIGLPFANQAAWEGHWAGEIGENIYVDNADLAYFSGHGQYDRLFFGVGGNLKFDCFAKSEEVAYDWGTIDNDWIVISGCSIFEADGISQQRWARAIYGTRLLIGMQTVMSDVNVGTIFGNNIRYKKSLTQAWFISTDMKLPQEQITSIMAEDIPFFGDKQQNHNSPTFVDDNYYLWVHAVGSELARPVDVGEITTLGMPILPVSTLTTAEAERRFHTLTDAFALTDTTPITSDAWVNDVDTLYASQGHYLSANGHLVMDRSAGSFHYANLDRLWDAQQVISATNSSDRINIDDETARRVADLFLQNHGLLPADAQYYEVIGDSIAGFQDHERFASEKPVSSTSLSHTLAITTNHQVIYSRVVSYTPPISSGESTNPVEFSVIGPGAKLKVYVDSTAPATATLESHLTNSVIGAMGGYRPIRPGVAAAATLTTSVRPFETIIKLLNRFEGKVALSHASPPAITREIITHTLAYWEAPMGWQQHELIPVYALRMQATQAASHTVTYDTYVPVNEQYMRPYAQIITPTQEALPGTALSLVAADATQTLAALGVDESLPFVLGSGKPNAYRYEWYVDQITAETKLGEGRNITWIVPDGENLADEPISLRIILVVIDSAAPQGVNANTDELLIYYNKTLLPVVQG